MEDENKNKEELLFNSTQKYEVEQDKTVSVSNQGSYSGSRKTVTVELNTYGVKYSYPGKEVIAKAHSKTFRMGEYQENYNSKCECCERHIPNKFFSVSDPIKFKSFFKYGIDLVNFLIVSKHYYFYIVSIYLSYVLQTIICVFLYGVPDVKFNLFYLELYYQLIIYGTIYKSILDLFFNLIRIGLLVSVYMKLKRKIKKTFDQYRKIVYDNHYLDESIYSFYVKNLPKLTDKEELKNHLKNEYDIKSVREIYLLKDVERLVNKYDHMQSLKDTRKRMEVTNVDMKYKLEDFEEIEVEISKHKSKLRDMVKSLEEEKRGSGTAIVVLENNEEKNILFRKDFYQTLVCCWYKKKSNFFKGKKIFLEPIPTMNQIDWKNSKYSLEKILTGSGGKSFISIVLFVTFSALLFYANYEISKFTTLNILNYNTFRIPFMRALFLVIFNFIFEQIIIICLSVFYVSDKYFYEIIVRYVAMQKTILSTILINILLYQKKLGFAFETQYLSFLSYVLLLALKSIFFTRFSEKYILGKIKYFVLTKILKRKLIQIDMNELYSDNVFNIIRVFEKYRLLVYTGIFLMKLMPISAILLFVCVFVHYLTIKWSLFNSCLKDINYFGYYFNVILQIEISSLVLVIVLLTVSSNLNYENSSIWVNSTFIVLNEILTILNFRTSLNVFTIDKDYSEMEGKFKRKFEDEKFVNLQILKSEIEKD